MTGKPIHILLVEDNPADVDLLRLALVEAGVDCDLQVVADGAQALGLIRNSGGADGLPAMAIIDLNLPKHGGLELLEEIRSNPTLQDLPVVILSSSSSPYELAALQRLGVGEHIVKPPDLDEFLRIGQTVKGLLARSASITR